MGSAPYQLSSYAQQASPGRRAAAFVLTLAAHLLILLLLLRLAPDVPDRPRARSGASTFQLLPEAEAEAVDAAAEAEKEEASEAASPAVEAPVSATEAAPPEPEPPPLNILYLNRRDFAAADIARHRSNPAPTGESANAEAGSAIGEGDDSAAGEARGPGGERLYDAEWYRRPTHTELASYLPAGSRAGWGMIACQTVEKNRVDNCQEIADWPSGSGFAGAVRRAAWQFLVLPPRIGGRPVIGAWVRIRIEYSQGKIRTR